MNLCGSLTYNKSPLLFNKTLFRLFVVALLFCYGHPLVSQTEEAGKQRPSKQFKPQYKIEQIVVTGNKRTKEKIILRELNFKTGDLITLNELDYSKIRSQQNLINTSLFNFVTITSQANDSALTLSIYIDVKERWYTWPSPIFEVQDRNFNSWWATKDLFRINYGMFLTFENVRGRNESVTLKFRRGYTEQYGVGYRIPYINKKQTIGLNFAYNFYRNNEIAYSTHDNQLLFYRNYRNYVRKEQEAKIGISYRDGLYMRHSFEALYKSSFICDTIRKLNASYFISDRSTISYFSLQYLFRYEVKDQKIYPLKGHSFEFNVIKDGLNLLKDETVDNLLLAAAVRNYWAICPRIYMATGLKLRYLLNNTQVYYFNRALGFNDFVRGYEYYVIDGQNFGTFKTTVKYQLVKPRVVKIPVKRFEKFKHIPYAVYLTTYGDAGYVQDKFYYNGNPLSNSWLIGCGVGVDLVTYYDYVLRLEASMNKMQQKGLFLHFSAPI